jgi:hypothetical protein
MGVAAATTALPVLQFFESLEAGFETKCWARKATI